MLADENITKDLSLASFVRPLEDVHFSIVIGVSRGWLKTSYYHNDYYYNIRILQFKCGEFSPALFSFFVNFAEGLISGVLRL